MQLDKDEVSLILSALEYDSVGTWGAKDKREERINALVAKIKRQEGARVQARCGHSDADNAQNKCVACGLNAGACCGVSDDVVAWCGVCWSERVTANA